MKRTQAGGLLSKTRSLRTAVLTIAIVLAIALRIVRALVLTIRSATTIAAIASRGFFLARTRAFAPAIARLLFPLDVLLRSD